MEVNEHDIDQFVRSQLKTVDRTYPSSWTPPDVLWSRLVQKRRQRLYRTRWLLSAAASIVILVTAGWLWQQTKLSNEAPSGPMTTGTTKAAQPEDHALAYIHKLCQGSNVVCTSPDFQTLKDDLAATHKSLNEVTQAMARFGQDEHLLRAKERIETHQARIIRAMVQML